MERRDSLRCLLSCRVQKKNQKTTETLSSSNFGYSGIAQVWCMSCVLLWLFVIFNFFPTLFFVSVVFWSFFSPSWVAVLFEMETVLCLYSSCLMSSCRLFSCDFGSITDAFSLLDYRHYGQHCWAVKKQLAGLIQVIMSVTNTVFRAVLLARRFLRILQKLQT